MDAGDCSGACCLRGVAAGIASEGDFPNPYPYDGGAGGAGLFEGCVKALVLFHAAKNPGLAEAFEAAGAEVRLGGRLCAMAGVPENIPFASCILGDGTGEDAIFPADVGVRFGGPL